jgi:hypothetical protein
VRKTKFDTYFDICEKLVPALASLESQRLAPMLEGLSSSITQIKNWLNDGVLPASKSDIATGLEQGVNELPLFIENIEPNLREEAFTRYHFTLNSVIPNYQEKMSVRIKRTLARGKINSESEFYLLRNRFDAIEDSESEESHVISELLGNYESSRCHQDDSAG